MPLPVCGSSSSAACPFADNGHAACAKIADAERATRGNDDVRCHDDRHTSCFYYFVHVNALRERVARRRDPERFLSRKPSITAVGAEELDELRPAG